MINKKSMSSTIFTTADWSVCLISRNIMESLTR